MQQNQLPITSNNLPSHTSFLYSTRLEDIKNEIIDPNSDTLEPIDFFLIHDFNWEYFRNELEFE